MNGEYAWWFLIVGLCVGAAGVWFVRGTLARTEEDVSTREREVEAAWISRTIEDAGGIAPADLVTQVLALHRAYLREAEPFETTEAEEPPTTIEPVASTEPAGGDRPHDDGTARLEGSSGVESGKATRRADVPRA